MKPTTWTQTLLAPPVLLIAAKQELPPLGVKTHGLGKVNWRVELASMVR